MRRLESVLVLGSAALKIGEAGEFDYSGSQAIKALKEEGLRAILVNPNVATLQTCAGLADEVYFVPVTPEFVTQVIAQERPGGILLGFGGQTALNCGVELARSGVLEAHGVAVLGTPISTIIDTEDRERFAARLQAIGVPTPSSRPVGAVAEALAAADAIGYPCMVRGAFSLGGLGSGICRDADELAAIAERALTHTGQILVEECLSGWKEIEYELVRDGFDNCIAVCNMENVDPMGIHTGESIVVAPSQTLNDAEYHELRAAALRVARDLGIVGECNIQYAVSPRGDGFRVIEVNARLSRSSALASKATGYPLAFVAAKVALGRSLVEMKNAVTRATSACFEPSLDYVAVKVPRWDFDKFQGAVPQLGSAMKSVGEVMAIGRRFEEALQKALRMIACGARGAVCNDPFAGDDLEAELRAPTDRRIFAVAEALRRGLPAARVCELTCIDPWFVDAIARLVAIETRIAAGAGAIPEPALLAEAKRSGFSDTQIAWAAGSDEEAVRTRRAELGLTPWVKQIDTLAGEHPAATNYLYLTYNGAEHDVAFEPGGVALPGPGTYRIGSSVEFDWCCVSALRTLRRLGYRTLMVNHNPETVSTDYDECDRLYFEELSAETVRDICALEQPLGLVLSFGGQIPMNLAMPCQRAGLRVLGTSPADVDRAENRHRFSSLLEELGIPQPQWRELTTVEDACAFAREVGFPVIVRPSYVLSGAAMAVAVDEPQLGEYLGNAVRVSPDHPVVVSKFIENAKEIDVDAVAENGEVRHLAVSEHVENAGVHSGDATLVLPPQRTYLETMRRVQAITTRVAKSLRITGPFNIQFLALANQVMVIECNLRASRSLPFASKVLGVDLIDLATRAIMGRPVPAPPRSYLDLDYVGVKAPQFSFTRLAGADPTLGVEMASTGEVACLGVDFEEAFLQALVAVGFRFPLKGALLSTGPLKSKLGFLEGARALAAAGVALYATPGTTDFLAGRGVAATAVAWPPAVGPGSALHLIKSRAVDLVINIPKHFQKEELTQGYAIRRAAADFGVPLITNPQLASRLTEALSRVAPETIRPRSRRSFGPY
jgi:carbamoyl-phosphate synthase large subunit